MSTREQAASKEDLKDLQKDLKLFKEEIVHEFHVVSEGLGAQIKLVAEGPSVLVERLDRIEKENERQHLETRSLIKLPFSDLQEWQKQLKSRHQT
jgi:hypothetical protein